MKPVTKEQFEFIQTNYVNPEKYELDLEIINNQILFETKITGYKNSIEGFIILPSFLYLFLNFFGLFVYKYISVNYEILINDFALWLISFLSWVGTIFLLVEILEYESIHRKIKKISTSIFSSINRKKHSQYKEYKSSFDGFLNELSSIVKDKIKIQDKLISEIREIRWKKYKYPISLLQELQIKINNYEKDFLTIKGIYNSLQLGLSEKEKLNTNLLEREQKHSDRQWLYRESEIQEAKELLNNEIINNEGQEAIIKEKELEEQVKRNERLAEYEKKRQEENRIYEENRQQRLKEAEERRKEREIILRIEQENRKQQKEEEKFQRFFKKQIEKTNNVLKPKIKVNKPRIKVNKVITPDKLKQIVERKLTIGTLGEQLIFEELKLRLISTIYQPLIEEFKHVSIEHGDGLGYDILAYNESAEKIYVEVKTTTAKYPAASFSKNEISFATQFDENYVLFLVHNLNTDYNSFEYIEIHGFSNVKEQLSFQPTNYKLRLKPDNSENNQ